VTAWLLMTWIDALGGIRIADEMTYLDHAATTPMLPEAVAALAAAPQRAAPARRDVGGQRGRHGEPAPVLSRL
jgi:hypothetical protein